MAVGYTARTVKTMSWSAKLVIAAALLAVLLVAAVPVALLVGVFMMLFGHVIAGLALFGGSILAAFVAVVIASMSGVRQLRKLMRQQGYRMSQLHKVTQLDRGDYYYE
ncbi:MAG TPA: hypothetical protein VHZ33_25755 [Trebonia sp.]|jgi:uncharacterized membrane protein YdjX (TVP38/TMEM64 family)|nr:hypothetical protein [Trebonia sp.]